MTEPQGDSVKNDPTLVLGFGWEDERLDMQKAGLKSLQEAKLLLKGYGDARHLALLPLLDDTEPEARYVAVEHLLKFAPERAMEVMRDLTFNCETHAHFETSMVYAEYLQSKRK